MVDYANDEPSDNTSADPLGIIDGYSAPETYTPSERERRIVSRFYDLFERAKANKYFYASTWDFNRNYLEGNQILYRDKITHDIVRLKTEKAQRLYSVNNQIQPVARSLHGKLVRSRPPFTVSPGTGEQDEIHGARVGDAYIRYFDYKQRIGLLYAKMMTNLLHTGNACIQLCWDPDGGRTLAFCEQCGYSGDEDLVGGECPDCLQLQQQAQQMNDEADMMAAEMGELPMPGGEVVSGPVPTLVAVKEGEEKAVVRDVENIYIDTYAVDPKDLNYVIVATVEPVVEVRRRFPHKASFVRASADILLNDTHSRTYNLDTNSWEQFDVEDHVMLYEYHEKPSMLHPEGRILWFANDMLLDEKPGYYKKFGRLPFFFQFWWKITGRFWAQSFIDQAASRQKELNELETSVREYQELIARAKVKTPLGSAVSSDELTARTGQVLQYNAARGSGPEYMVPPEMPQSVFARKSELISEIGQHAAVTTAERGLGSDSSGRQLAILQAEGDQQLAGPQEYNWAELCDFYKCMLVLVMQMHHPERKFMIAGDYTPEVYSISDLNLKDGWDVQVEQSDGLSSNPALRLVQVADFVNMGLYTNPKTGLPDTKSISKAARLKLPGLGTDMVQTEYAAAQMNIKLIEHGRAQDAQPNIEDDPEIFSEVYLHWLRAKGRRRNDEVTEQVRQLYMYYQQQILMAEQSMAMSLGTGEAQQPGGKTGSRSGQDMTAKGGTPNNPGHINGQQVRAKDTDVATDAIANIQQADAYGESLARPQQQHEG